MKKINKINVKMSTTKEQCVSPIVDLRKNARFRCPKTTIGKSQFCKEHADLYRSDYLRYKKLELRLIKMQISVKSNIRDILRAYSFTLEAYTRRAKFRSKAFIKEAWDSGHDLRISMLWNRLDYYRDLLSDKFQIESKFEVVTDSPNIKEEDVTSKTPAFLEWTDEETPDENLITKKLRKIHKTIEETEKEFETLVPKAILEKREQYERNSEYYYKLDKKIQIIINVPYIKHFILFSVLSEEVFRKYSVKIYSRPNTHIHNFKLMLMTLVWDMKLTLDCFCKLKVEDIDEILKVKVWQFWDKNTTVNKNATVDYYKQIYDIYSRLENRNYIKVVVSTLPTFNFDVKIIIKDIKCGWLIRNSNSLGYKNVISLYTYMTSFYAKNPKDLEEIKRRLNTHLLKVFSDSYVSPITINDLTILCTMLSEKSFDKPAKNPSDEYEEVITKHPEIKDILYEIGKNKVSETDIKLFIQLFGKNSSGFEIEDDLCAGGCKHYECNSVKIVQNMLNVNDQLIYCSDDKGMAWIKMDPNSGPMYFIAEYDKKDLKKTWRAVIKKLMN